jgi:hypothetical protein
VTLPKSIERLQEHAFYGCTNLKRIVCAKRYPPIILDAFDSYNITVLVPEGMQNKYYADKYWKFFKEVEEM